MPENALYKKVLMDHFRHPRNEGDLGGADIVRRGQNPRCGDEIEIGLFRQGDRLDRVRFRGRGCSICIAAASMLTEAVRGRTHEEAVALSHRMHRWFENGNPSEAKSVPDYLSALSAVRAYPARRQCVLISWDALSDALSALKL